MTLFEFDVISKENGENHYRVQILEKKQTLPSESGIKWHRYYLQKNGMNKIRLEDLVELNRITRSRFYYKYGKCKETHFI